MLKSSKETKFINPFKHTKLTQVRQYSPRKIFSAHELNMKFYNSKEGKKAYKIMSKKYPDHNYPGPDTEKATKYLMKEIKKKYHKEYNQVNKKELYDDIYDGLT